MTGLKNLSLYFLLAVLASKATGASAQDVSTQAFVQGTGSNVNSPQEKLFLHTDKNFYLAGEIIWFKIYCVNAADQQPVNLSKLAYVEIIDRTGKPVLQGKIELTVKGGNGSFYLPVSLPSDVYTLRAYTNWMKNAGADAFFEKPVTIVNTVKVAEQTAQPEAKRVLVSFFPESGQLVNNIETTVAFQVRDASGKGMEAKGTIVSDKGDTITRFSTHRFGLGHFSFKPLPGVNYKAVVETPAAPSTIEPLPGAADAGYVINVTDNNDGRWRVRIAGKANTAGGETVYLLASARKVLRKALSGYLDYSQELVLYVDKNAVGDGATELTLLNKDRQPVAERLVFRKPSANGITAAVTSDKDHYATRQPVNLSFSVDDNSAIAGSYSVSVYQLDSLEATDDIDIASYFGLFDELHGQVESPSFYLSNDPDAQASLDDLLLTNGWRKFRDNTASATVFAPEYRGHRMTARVTSVNGGKPAAGITCYLSFPSTPFGLYVGKSDSLGYVHFDVNDYYGPGDIVIQAARLEGEPVIYHADILTPFWTNNSAADWSRIVLDRQSEQQLTQKSIAMQAQNIYSADSIRRFHAPTFNDTLPFYGKAEFSYKLDDYKRFTTMEEVLREYVLPVNVGYRNGKLNMRVFDDEFKNLYTDNVFVMIDGVPLMDFNKFFSYDPLKVKKLDVIPRRYLLGPSAFAGILSAETYDGKFDAFELDPSLVAVDYEGLQLHREFFAPEYSTTAQAQSRVPDMRTTLYWVPDLNAANGKASLHFYSSDQRGNFAIVLQGINAKGQPVVGTGSFRVE